jgi:hypothetical protein
MKIQENQVELEMNETHQLLVYVNDVTLLHKNINKNGEALIRHYKEISLQANTKKMKYMFMPHIQHPGQNYSLMTTNKFFASVATFKYLITITNQNHIHEEIKSRLYSGNACYHSIQDFTSSYL